MPRLTAYLLSPDHPVGKHKARVFLAALGLQARDAAALRAWLVQVAATGDAEFGASDQYGQRFVIRSEMRYNGREAMIRTVWIVRPSSAAPEFLTALVE
jgi:hypothetical protein